MFKSIFRDKKNERIGLLIATVMFGLIALLQLWRAFAGVSVVFDGHAVPVWISAVLGLVALFMAFWMGMILRQNRPVL